MEAGAATGAPPQPSADFTILRRHRSGSRRAAAARMNTKLVLAFVVFVPLFGCGKEESTASKPVTCEVAGKMLSKRFGEFADKAKVVGEKRVELDAAMAAAITTRCTEDKWEEVTLGCLGAMATIKDGEIDVETYRKGIDVCTNAIGKASAKKLDDAVANAVGSVMKTAP